MINTLTKLLAGIEDLLLGEGTENQTRNGTVYPITKIGAASLPYDDTLVDSIKDKLDEDAANIASLTASILYNKNSIYNGKMTISQRGDYTSASSAVNDIYYLDRWKTILNTVSADIQDMGGALRYTATSTDIGYLGVQQIYEMYSSFAGKVVTVSGYIKSNSINARLKVNDGVAVTQGAAHSGDGGKELHSLTFTVNAAVTVLELQALLCDNGAVSITSGDYVELSDVRLDIGNSRLSGDREYTEELVLCQRYYEKSFHIDTVPAIAEAAGRIRLINLGSATFDISHNLQFKVRKVGAPTMVGYTATGGTTTPSFDNFSQYGGNMFINLAASGIDFSHWTAESEL